MKEFFEFIINYAKANIRNKRIMAAERIGLRLTNRDRRTRYIIRGPKSKYVVFTNLDVDGLKARGVLRADTNIYTLSKIADSEVRFCPVSKRAYVVGKNK